MAGPDQKGTGEREKPMIVLVAPNGAERPERYHPNQTVGHVLEKSIRDFAKDGLITDTSIKYVLVRGATPLEPGMTLEEAGVQPGERLNVRARAIPRDG